LIVTEAGGGTKTYLPMKKNTDSFPGHFNNSEKPIEISPLISRLRFVGGIGDPSDSQNPTACVMSAAAANYRLSQGESIGDATDQLDCCCPVIRRLCIRRNDGWWPSDEARKEWALGLIARLPGTRGDMATTLRRGFRCADMTVRVLAPMVLRDASHEDLAAQLEAVSPIVDVESAKAARIVTQQVRKSVGYDDANYAANYADVAYDAATAATNVGVDGVYAVEIGAAYAAASYAHAAAYYTAIASTYAAKKKTWASIEALIEEFVSETHPQM
jgi:hypothetical protein